MLIRTRDVGELRDPETHLIPRAMMAIQGYITDFAVFGTDYDTPDGTPIRDYIHVSDLADAHVAALRRLLAGASGGAFNLGTGRGYSVKQVLDAIAAETGETVEILSAPRRRGDPAELVADASLSRTELGFDPIYPTCKQSYAPPGVGTFVRTPRRLSLSTFPLLHRGLAVRVRRRTSRTVSCHLRDRTMRGLLKSKRPRCS